MQTLFAPATGFRSHALNLTPFTGTGIPFAPLKFPGHSQIHSAHLKYNLESRFDVGSGKFYRCHRTRVSASATPAAGGKDSWLLEFVGDGDSSHIGKRVPLPGAFELASDAATVGRLAEKADIVIPVATVSGLHARLEKKEGLLLVTDLNSTNGTYIDDKKLSPGTVTTLSPGSCITFGDTHLAAFRVSKVDSIGAPPQADISNQQVIGWIQSWRLAKWWNR